MSNYKDFGIIFYQLFFGVLVGSLSVLNKDLHLSFVLLFGSIILILLVLIRGKVKNIKPLFKNYRRGLIPRRLSERELRKKFIREKYLSITNLTFWNLLIFMGITGVIGHYRDYYFLYLVYLLILSVSVYDYFKLKTWILKNGK